MRFSNGISALDYSQKESATLLHEGGTYFIICRIEFIPDRLLLSKACVRLTQLGKFQNQILYYNL